MITEQEIMAMLREFVLSPEGSALLKKHHKQLGVDKKYGEFVDKILGDIREKFIKAIQSKIQSFRVDAVTTYRHRAKDGQIRAELRIDSDALRRQSLYNNTKDGERRQAGGIDDILALFTHGYQTTHRVPYGYWDRSDGSSVLVRALSHRDPDAFLQKCVDRLNAQYSGVCQITLNTKYL